MDYLEYKAFITEDSISLSYNTQQANEHSPLTYGQWIILAARAVAQHISADYQCHLLEIPTQRPCPTPLTELQAKVESYFMQADNELGYLLRVGYKKKVSFPTGNK